MWGGGGSFSNLFSAESKKFQIPISMGGGRGIINNQILLDTPGK